MHIQVITSQEVASSLYFLPLLGQNDRSSCCKHNSTFSYKEGSMSRPFYSPKVTIKQSRETAFPFVRVYGIYLPGKALRNPCNKEQSQSTNSIPFPLVRKKSQLYGWRRLQGHDGEIDQGSSRTQLYHSSLTFYSTSKPYFWEGGKGNVGETMYSWHSLGIQYQQWDFQKWFLYRGLTHQPTNWEMVRNPLIFEFEPQRGQGFS